MPHEIQPTLTAPTSAGPAQYKVIGTVKTQIGGQTVPVPNARVEILEYDPPSPSGSMVPILIFPFQPAPARSFPENRSSLGAVFTDHNGNFEFSFYWLPKLTDSGFTVDQPGRYDGVPDVIVRVSQSLDGRTVELAETDPYMNIGTHQVLGDILVPAERVLLLPNTRLNAGPKGFQAIGFLPLDGSRLQDGYATSQSGDLVSCKNAPFGDVLELYALFDDTRVTHYRLRHAPAGTNSFEDADDSLRNYVYDPQRQVWKSVVLGPAETGGVANLYRAIEGETGYLFDPKLKARWSTYDLAPGKHVLRLEGYRLDPATGQALPLTGAVYDIELRIDNVRPTAEILGIYKEGAAAAESECGIIDLRSDPAQKLRVKIKVRDPEGHLGAWSLSTHHGYQRYAGDAFTGGEDYRALQNTSVSWHGPGETEVILPVSSGQSAARWMKCAYSFDLYAVGRSTDGRASRLSSQESRFRVNTYIDA